MTVYTITLQNNHGVDGDYSFFVDPPKVTSSGTSRTVFTNSWITEWVPEGGRFDVTTSEEIYAWAGTVPRSPAPGVTVRGGVSRLAELGTPNHAGSTFEMKIQRNTPTLTQMASTAVNAAFEIDTGTDFPSPNHRFIIGMGKTDGHGLVSPVASALAMNNMRTQITPKAKFYVAQYSYVAGEIVDWQSVSRVAAEVDFSSGEGAGKTVAVVTHENKGSFAIKYFDTYQA